MKTKAALLVQTGKPLELAELEIPKLKPGQVLVEIAYSGACGTQVMETRGLKGEDKYLPHCLGHEGTGTVLETGEGITKVKAGDKVVLSWLKGPGIEAGGAVYQWNGKNVNAGGVTTFQKHAVVSENRLTLLPKNIEMDTAVLLGCAAPTGMGAVMNVLKLQPGQSIAVFGTGGIGLNAVLAAFVCGAKTIFAIDPHTGRRALAKLYGATHTVNPAEGDVLDQIHSVAPNGVDVAVEATGIPVVMDQAINAVRARGGRAVVIGNAQFGAELKLNPAVFNQGKSLMGTWGGDSVPDRDMPRYAQMLCSCGKPVKSLLSEPYSLEQANIALNDLASGKVGRPLIDMSL